MGQQNAVQAARHGAGRESDKEHRVKSMKAAVLHGCEDLRYQDAPEPVPHPGAAIIKVEAAAICNATDNKTFRSKITDSVWPHLKPPFILGHEVCGRIVEKTDEVTKFDVGDRVALWGGGTGGFAEYFLIHPSELPAIVKLPPSIDSVTGAMMEMVGGTTRHLVTKDDQWLIDSDSVVVVFGLGPSGILYLQEARILGAATVIGVGKHDFRLNKAKEFGADEVMDYRDGDVAGRIKDQYGPVDMVIDTTGKDVIPESLAIMKREGIFVPFGLGPCSVPQQRKRLAPKDIIVTAGGNDQLAIESGRDWIADGRLRIDPLVTAHVPLKEVRRGLDACMATERNVLKIAVDIP